MSPMTADELPRIRDKIRDENAVRHGVGRAKVIIHMGTCGITSGARDVLESLLVDMKKHKAADIIVTVDDRIGLRDSEPLVTIQEPGQQPFKYEKMNPDKVRHVFKEHIIGTGRKESCEGK